RALGAVLVRLGRPDEALRVLDLALDWFTREDDPERVAQARLSRGIALRALGRAGEALRDLDAAGARFRATGNARFLERVEDERARAFESAGDWRGAYRARTAQIALQRELADKLREEQSSRLRVAFDTEKKERENRALMRENALRGEALRNTLRIRRLQTAVLALSTAVMVVLAALVFRHLTAARRMRALALTDELTRLPNRRHLLRLADEQVEAARRAGETFGVLALDVDHFKRINDTFGHEVGDRVLQRVAHACRSALRHDDVMGRTGGEEFVVLLPGADGLVAVEVAERLRTAVERVEWSDLSPELGVTVSVGAAQLHKSDESFADAARRADASLYRAKAAGRNRTELAATPA
ncbi:MAG TPA: tetratricopeptide repeat-containing diguanylate cyclase, partial [Longimicrobium sp.]|nr:tetratricopeptide repeat-containing diguanylate cyclase [Longimicrobium sp.]